MIKQILKFVPNTHLKRFYFSFIGLGSIYGGFAGLNRWVRTDYSMYKLTQNGPDDIFVPIINTAISSSFLTYQIGFGIITSSLFIAFMPVTIPVMYYYRMNKEFK